MNVSRKKAGFYVRGRRSKVNGRELSGFWLEKSSVVWQQQF